MDPISVVFVAKGVVSVAGYVGSRDKLKKGDVLIHNEADHERLAEGLDATPKDLIKHPLHPHHLLTFDQGDTPFSCNACSQEGADNRYCCKSCDFSMHRACAISEDISVSLTSEKTKLVSFIHDHPLTLVKEVSKYTCNYCNNKSDTKERYRCEPCKLSFDLMCVTHTTRLLSFLHPQHELEPKTKDLFKKCAVCRNSGESNARVYTCRQCEFYVHPDCAATRQYLKHPLHADHSLVFSKVPSKTSVVCKACDKKCKHWCYSCPLCKEVCFHPECVDPKTSTMSRSDSGSVGRFVEQASKGMVGELATGIFKVAIGDNSSSTERLVELRATPRAVEESAMGVFEAALGDESSSIGLLVERQLSSKGAVKEISTTIFKLALGDDSSSIGLLVEKQTSSDIADEGSATEISKVVLDDDSSSTGQVVERQTSIKAIEEFAMGIFRSTLGKASSTTERLVEQAAKGAAREIATEVAKVALGI